MIDKIALLCSSIPLFNALSDLLTNLENYSYTSGWAMYNQIYAMDNQLPTWRGASISIPHGHRFYFRNPLEYAWYLLHQCPCIDHMVNRPTLTVDVEGDRVNSDMNSPAWWWRYRIDFLCCHNWSTYQWIRPDPAHGLLRRQESLAVLSHNWKYQFPYTEQIQLPRATRACLPHHAAQFWTDIRIQSPGPEGYKPAGAVWCHQDTAGASHTISRGRRHQFWCTVALSRWQNAPLLANSCILAWGSHGACQPYGRPVQCVP